jgi:phosphinothricin acetyltransferase
MTRKTQLRTRPGTVADAAAIAEIYNQGIADRIATFETEPRSAADIAEWFTPRHLVVVAESAETGPVGFAALFPYSSRACYSGIGEFSVYVRRDFRGRGAGRAVLGALIEAAAIRGLHKLTSRVFPENLASRALLKGLGFAEIGVHRRHGQLDSRWRDCVIVELLLAQGWRRGPTFYGDRCQTSRRRKIDAAAPVMQASPQVPKLKIQAARCDVPPN